MRKHVDRTAEAKSKSRRFKARENRRRQQAVAKNLATGMGQEEALIEAGYSPTTARKRAYKVVQLPIIQSLLTESCQRIMQK